MKKLILLSIISILSISLFFINNDSKIKSESKDELISFYFKIINEDDNYYYLRNLRDDEDIMILNKEDNHYQLKDYLEIKFHESNMIDDIRDIKYMNKDDIEYYDE